MLIFSNYDVSSKLHEDHHQFEWLSLPLFEIHGERDGRCEGICMGALPKTASEFIRKERKSIGHSVNFLSLSMCVEVSGCSEWQLKVHKICTNICGFLRPAKFKGLLIYESSKSLPKWLKLFSRCAKIVQEANFIFMGCFLPTTESLKVTKWESNSELNWFFRLFKWLH